jgi:hypothetical protein
MGECIICYDKFTTSVRKEILCPHCHSTTCCSCVKKYLLESAKDPHCPSCSKAWTRFFLQQNLPKSFIDNDYAKCRANILWSKEESYIPQAQIKAIRVQKADEYTESKIIPITKTLKQLREKELELRKTISELENELYYRKDTRGNILNGTINDEENKVEIIEIEIEKNSFKRKCANQGCLGWLSSSWKCGLCENYTCIDCFKIIGKKKKSEAEEEHICDPSDIETAKLIKASTKPCPKCGEAIEKGEGCDVMFCTSCHTGFNWITRKVLQDTQIHNPHYFEWQANNTNQGQNNNFCNNRLGGFMVNRVASHYRTQFGKMIRMIMHVEDIEYAKYDYHFTHENNEDLLVEYLLKRKTKEEIKRTLQNRERRTEREKAIRDVLETFVMAGKDIVYSILQNYKKIEELFEDLNKLRDFVNESLKNVSKLYGCQVPNIIDWERIETINVKIKDSCSSLIDSESDSEIKQEVSMKEDM